MEYLNPFDDPQQACHVLINAQRQYSLWPVFSAIPAGWQPVFGPQPQSACLDWLEANWRDIRPTSSNATGSSNV